MNFIEATVFGSTGKVWEVDMAGWNGSAERYFLNSYWKDAFDAYGKWLVRFRVTSTIYFTGWCHITGISWPAVYNEIVKETVNFQGWNKIVCTVP